MLYCKGLEEYWETTCSLIKTSDISWESNLGQVYSTMSYLQNFVGGQ